MDVSTKYICQEPKSSSQQNKEHKIVIIGDGHAPGSANNVKHNLNDNYRCSGFVRPGANIDTITSSVMEDIKHLTHNDFFFWIGTNDASKNNSQDGLKHITNVVKVNSHRNIILMSFPHRHNLPEWSSVNSEVKAFNRKLVKLMKPHKHVTVVKVDLDRKSFTRQGMHMNNSGKDKLALKTANVVTKIFLKQEEMISLHWKNENEGGVSDSSTEDNTLQADSRAAPSVTPNVETLTNDAAKDELIFKEPRTLKRQKMPSTLKSDDILW
jgi:hypothetical protein